MEITVEAGALLRELDPIANVAARSKVIDVLKYVRLEAQGASIGLTGTDMDIWLLSSCAADVKAPGVALLPASRLRDLVKFVPADSSVRIVANEKHGCVTVNNYAAKLQTLPPSEFPIISPTPDGPAVTLTADVVLSLIRHTEDAVLQAGYKTAIPGAELRCGGETVRMCSTDGHRIHVSSAASPGVLVAILKRPALSALAQFMVGATSAEFVTDDNRLFVTAGDRRLIAKLLEAKMANWERMWPKAPASTFFLDRDVFADALKRVGLVLEKQEHLGLSFALSDETLVVNGLGVNIGEASERLIVTQSGPACEFKADSKYILDFLSAAAPGDISIGVNDHEKPFICAQLGDAPTKFECVIAPMRASKKDSSCTPLDRGTLNRTAQ